MIEALIVLLLFQLVGEIIARALHLPLPGPVIGMLLLFAALLWRGSIAPTIQLTAQGLLQYLSLLFVPAGVGIIAHIALIRDTWLPTLLTLVLSLVLTMVVTALTLQGLLRLRHSRAQGASSE